MTSPPAAAASSPAMRMRKRSAATPSPPMKWAVGTGVINGSENRLLPRNMATRGEAAAMFMRFCRKVAQAAR